MKLLLIGNYAPGRQQSMQRYAVFLYEELRKRGVEAQLFRPSPLVGKVHPGETGVGKWLGYVDRLILFPPRLRHLTEWADIVHICDQGNAMYVPWIRTKPNVVTCHDMLAIRSAIGEIPENPTRWSGRMLQRWALRGLRQAQHVVCVSKATQADLLRVARLPAARVSVVTNALNYPYCPTSLAEATGYCRTLGVGGERPFLMHVGGNDWYKNREGVLRIFRTLIAIPGYERYHLVMVGKPWTAQMRAYLKRVGLREKVHEVIDAHEDSLQALYSSAEALIFPSLYEGFGWPIIEAQACGCPVFTSNRPPMTEVGGDAAIYIDPKNDQTAARVIATGLEKRDNLIKLGFRNLERFSIDRMIDGYLAAYESVRAHASATTSSRATHDEPRAP